MGKGDCSTLGCSLVKTLGNTELKSQTSNLVPCQVSSRALAGIYLARMIDTAEGLHAQPGVSIARAVCQLIPGPLGRQVKVLAVNESGARLIILQHDVIASLEPITEAEICSISVASNLDRVAEAEPKAVDLEWQNSLTLSDLIDPFQDVIATSDLDFGSTNWVQCTIDTGDAALIRQWPYKTPFMQRPVVEKQLAELLQTNIIHPSFSPWASPIVLVTK